MLESSRHVPPLRPHRVKTESVNPGSTRVSRAGEGDPPSRTSMTHRFGSRSRTQYRCVTKVRFGGTPQPALGTSALPGTPPSRRIAGGMMGCSLPVQPQQIHSALWRLEAAGCMSASARHLRCRRDKNTPVYRGRDLLKTLHGQIHADLRHRL